MLFRDPERQAAFDEAGYVVLDLLAPEAVEALLRLYQQTVSTKPMEDLWESSQYCTQEENLRIMAGIREVLAPPTSRFFADGEVFGGTFYNKVPITSGLMPLHQDWCVVDEERYQSAYVWCALVDVLPERGGIFVLPGSHRFFDNLRSGSMPSLRIQPSGPIADLVVDVPLRAGQAAVWSDRLFHGSWPNRTAEPRIICTGRVNEEGAKLLYYHRSGEDRVTVMAVDPKWWLTDCATLIQGGIVDGSRVVRSFPYRYEGITQERMLERLAELGKLPRVTRDLQQGQGVR